jgi:MFS transporter, DHA3 family, macrolide efflux protein
MSSSRLKTLADRYRPDVQAASGRVAAWRQLLASRDFTWLWTGQVISQIGDGLSKVALLWFVYNLTGSALKMTIVGILQTIPPLVLGPFAGAYLDRLPKRAAMIVIDLVRVLLLALIPMMYALGALTLTWLYLLVFLIALVSMAYSPALNAAIPLVAKRDQLTTANALMQSTATIGQLFGPALSGMLIVVMGAQNVLLVNAVTFLISAFCKLPVRLSKDVDGSAVQAAGEWLMEDLRTGFRFVFLEKRMILLLMATAALFNLGATGFIFLLPVITEKVLHASSVELGWLWSAFSLGLLLTAGWLVWKKQPALCTQLGLLASAAIAGGVAIFGMAIFISPVASILLIIAIGGSAGLVTPIVSAALQELTPRNLLARVFSFFNTGTMACAMLGMMIFGWTADRLGPWSALVGIGFTQIATGIFTALLIPWCRSIPAERKV